MSEFFGLSMGTILNKCHEVIDHTPEDEVLEAVINLPAQVPVGTKMKKVNLVPGEYTSPVGRIVRTGELKTAFGEQACARFKIIEILKYFSTKVAGRTEEEIEEYERSLDEDG